MTPAALAPFLTAAAFVFLNEMGDKSQLLAAALATRMRWWRVLLGVALAVLLDNGLAVAAGSLLAHTPGLGEWVQLASSGLFLVFGLWSLAGPGPARPDARGHRAAPQPAGLRKAGGVAAVACTFFFAEMGDKTQLTAMTLAARFAGAPLWVLAGTVAGMLAADGAAVAAGTLLHSRLSASRLRLLSAALFILFGLAGIYDGLVNLLLFRPAGALAVTALLGLLTVFLGWPLRRAHRSFLPRNRAAR